MPSIKFSSIRVRDFLRLIFVASLYSLNAFAEAPTKTIRLPIVRDTWLSSVPQERLGSNGAAARLKLKSYQEMSVVDFDAAPLQGKVVLGGELHVRNADRASLLRVTTSSLAAPWVEGDGTGYSVIDGVSSFQYRQHPNVPWSSPRSDLTSVMLGQGHTWWSSQDATAPDPDGWQIIPVSKEVIAARVAQLSEGIVLFDDTGSEWTRDGEQFTVHPFPNRYVYSRQQNASSAPYLTVTVGKEDTLSPLPPTEFSSDVGDLPAGEAWVSWLSPPDQGEAGTLGFVVEFNGQPIPRYLIPQARVPGTRLTMHLRDLSDVNAKSGTLSIRSVDAAGNRSERSTTNVTLSQRTTWVPRLKPSSKDNANETQDDGSRSTITRNDIPIIDGVEVAVIDELDKVNPKTGQSVPELPKGYLLNNHLWNAETRTVQLEGARNEFIAFQLITHGPVDKFNAAVEFPGLPNSIDVAIGRYVNITDGDKSWPDPIEPLGGSEPVSSADDKSTTFKSYHVELLLPDNITSGDHVGKLKLEVGNQTVHLTIKLHVWNFSLPDRLSFLPEMNCYGLPENELDYYQLAHRHRTVLNRLPYYHNGRIADGCAPTWNGETFDWTDWDKRFGPLLDGTAFSGQPRKGEPIECFYLPLFENWPTPIEPHYHADYWADKALSSEYRKRFVLASRLIANHLHQPGWNKTLFHFYLNGKNNFKEKGWSRSTSPWILDEPQHYQDFFALRWFGQAFHEGIALSSGPSQILFRADISRPEWQRDSLDGLINYNVVGSAFRRYPRIVLDRRAANHERVIEYGSSNRLDQSNLQPVAWCIDSWSQGLDGVLPWQTIGTEGSWKSPDELSLFYPPRPNTNGKPVPSVRLKSYRRGQQDVEYFEQLRQSVDEPRWAVGRWIQASIPLDGKREGTDAEVSEDAGRIHYASLQTKQFWALRRQAAMEIEANALAK